MDTNRQPTVLIVEDNSALVEVYRVRLETDGYRVVTASDGQAGLDLAYQVKPDLILLDIMLPKISGFDFLEAIRARPDLARTPVVVLSALGEKSDITRGQKFAVSRWLVKSQATLETVIANIRAALAAPDGLPQA